MKQYAFLPWAMILGLGGLGCGGGSPVTYYKTAVGKLSALTGTNCPMPSGTMTVNITGIDGAGTIALYPQPNARYFLDLGAFGSVLGTGSNDIGLTGTQDGSGYSFKGTWTRTERGPQSVTTEVTVTITIKPTGQAMTGTLAFDFKCNSTDGQMCGQGNALANLSLPGVKLASPDAHDFECSTSAPLLGAQLDNVQAAASAQTAPPLPQ